MEETVAREVGDVVIVRAAEGTGFWIAVRKHRILGSFGTDRCRIMP